jgi:NAD+ diphosphatase
MCSARLPRLALSQAILDRVDQLRSSDAAILRYWRSEQVRVFELFGDVACIDMSGDHASLVLRVGPNAGGSELPSNVFFLGVHESVPYFGQAELARTPGQAIFRTLREVGTDLSPLEAELFTTTQSLAKWHATHPRCSRCGERTDVVRAGWVRRCPQDGSEHYPRTDPAVIMLVTDPQDRALLGRRASWAPQWFSTLAGFVEPGEAAESAVVREVREEAGVCVDPSSVEALGSQPWPFPSSIMLGFCAQSYTSDDPVTDDEEIVEARWFTRDELAAACASGDVAVPPHISIARHLIEDWFGSELPGSWSRP